MQKEWLGRDHMSKWCGLAKLVPFQIALAKPQMGLFTQWWGEYSWGSTRYSERKQDLLWSRFCSLYRQCFATGISELAQLKRIDIVLILYYICYTLFTVLAVFQSNCPKLRIILMFQLIQQCQLSCMCLTVSLGKGYLFLRQFALYRPRDNVYHFKITTSSSLTEGHLPHLSVLRAVLLQ